MKRKLSRGLHVRRKSDGKLFAPSPPPGPRLSESDIRIGLMSIARPFSLIPVEKAPWWQFWRKWRPTDEPAWVGAKPDEFVVA